MKYYFILALSFLFVFYTSGIPISQELMFLTQNKTCDVCKDMVGLIDHELNLGNKTIIVDNIQKIVDDLCKCMNATTVCETLKLC